MVVEWSGVNIVGRAVNVLHFDGSDSDVDPADVKTAYTLLQSALPISTTITIPNTGDVIDDATGNLVRVWAGTGGGAVSGSSTDTSAAGVGACVTWNTGAIVGTPAHKLRGRTFLVPLSTFAYDQSGTLTVAQLAAVNAFATSLRTNNVLGVWHRPTTSGGSDGTSSGVISHQVRDKVAILTSRRD